MSELERKYKILQDSFERLEKKCRDLEAENEDLRMQLLDSIADIPTPPRNHRRRLSADIGECEFCGKMFKSLEAKLRHQRRSKICQTVRKLPETSDDIVQEAMKCLHGVIIKEHVEHAERNEK